MPTIVPLYRCLVISPSDVREEREAIKDTIHRWNSQIGEALGARLEPVLWESHSVPEVGGQPQELLNRQIVDQCDLGVAVFWSRIGTPTDAHASGSLEEIAKLSSRRAPVLIYFCERPIPPSQLDTEQFEKLKSAKQDLKSRAIVSSYQDTANLSQDLLLHLTRRISALIEATQNPTAQGEDDYQHVLTAPVPDVQVRIHSMFAVLGGRSVDTLTVSVENHSPIPVYHSGISLELDDGSGLWVAADFITGLGNQPVIIQPGDSISFNFDPKGLNHQQISRVKFAVARDKIGRIYRSDPEETREALKRWDGSESRRLPSGQAP